MDLTRNCHPMLLPPTMWRKLRSLEMLVVWASLAQHERQTRTRKTRMERRVSPVIQMFTGTQVSSRSTHFIVR